MTQTRRFLGGRHPLCGIGVTSRIERICRPAVASAWIADSRPEPGPCTRTCTRRTPRFIASRAACSAATVAANGVDFLEPGLARGSPGEGVPLHIRDRDERVIERRRDVAHAFGLDHLLGALRARCFRLCHLLFQEGLLLARNRAPRPLLGARVGVLALAV